MLNFLDRKMPNTKITQLKAIIIFVYGQYIIDCGKSKDEFYFN